VRQQRIAVPPHFQNISLENACFVLGSGVSSLKMIRSAAIQKRDKLAAALTGCRDVLRGSLLQRTTFHSSGCPKCARGEGHPQWVLNVNYPGAKTRQLSLRPEQLPEVREALQRYRQAKETLEAISELNQYLLRLDRDESKERNA
jgi:hypothetical protein